MEIAYLNFCSLLNLTIMISNYLFCRVIIGAPKADTSQYQAGVRQGGAVYRCDISDDNRCQIIHFDASGKCERIDVKSTNTNQTSNNEDYTICHSTKVKNHRPYNSMSLTFVQILEITFSVNFYLTNKPSKKREMMN